MKITKITVGSGKKKSGRWGVTFYGRCYFHHYDTRLDFYERAGPYATRRDATKAARILRKELMETLGVSDGK